MYYNIFKLLALLTTLLYVDNKGILSFLIHAAQLPYLSAYDGKKEAEQK
ncbi:hypothetical protein [Staphylococcus debuckii]|nr:hypothetical protein [Staphylococcus debuckii]